MSKIDTETPELLGAIERLYALYARCIDNDELEGWPDYFTEDCVYQITTADNVRRGLPIGVIYANSRNMLIDRVRSLRQANVYEKQFYRHVMGRSLLLPAESADVIATETPFMVTRIMHDGTFSLFATGRYQDQVVVSPDHADIKIKQRIVVCDSALIDTLLAIPL